MTARRTPSRLPVINTTTGESNQYNEYIDKLRDVVDSIKNPLQEHTVNSVLNVGFGDNRWSNDGVYIKNTDALQMAYGGQIGGDCFLKSLECYWKLRGIGAKRMCGIRSVFQYADTDDHPHFWVESKGKVFDWGGGQEKIYDKERFYTEMRIINPRVGNDIGCFQKDEYEIELEEKTRYILIKYGVKALIRFIQETNRDMNWNSYREMKKNGINETRFAGIVIMK